MDKKIDIKTVITIMAVVFSAGGVFWQVRGNAAEIQELRYNIHELRGELIELDHYVRNGMGEKYITRREAELMLNSP